MTTQRYVVGIGNPIIDISGTVTEETMTKYNLEFGKTVFCNDTNVYFYNDLEAQPDVEYIPGGSVTNSIRVCNVK